jgi:hypothetical protein
MHPKPEVIEVELGEVVAVNRIRIKVVLLQPAPKRLRSLYFPQRKPALSKMPEAMTDARTLIAMSFPKPFIASPA